MEQLKAQGDRFRRDKRLLLMGGVVSLVVLAVLAAGLLFSARSALAQTPAASHAPPADASASLPPVCAQMSQMMGSQPERGLCQQMWQSLTPDQHRACTAMSQHMGTPQSTAQCQQMLAGLTLEQRTLMEQCITMMQMMQGMMGS